MLFGSNISSTESNVLIDIDKAWNSIGILATICESNLYDIIITGILPSCSLVSTIIWLHNQDSTDSLGEKDRWELHKNAVCCFEQILEAAPPK